MKALTSSHFPSRLLQFNVASQISSGFVDSLPFFGDLLLTVKIKPENYQIQDQKNTTKKYK